MADLLSQHDSAPWPENLAVPIPAYDSRLLLNGSPLNVPCRILSEPNYQHARACVNSQKDLVKALEVIRDQDIRQPGSGAAARNIAIAALNKLKEG